MRKLSLVLSLLVFCVPFAEAQKPDAGSEARSEAAQARKALIDEFRLERAQEKQATAPGKFAALAPVTDAEVGEAASFDKNAKFFGTATAGVVVVSAAGCAEADTGFPLGPDDRCLLVTDPAVTTMATYNDIGRISLPGKKADNVIYAIGNHTVSAFSINNTAFASSGLVSYIPSVTIESEALLDPAAIDPSTGLPMNGSFTTTGLGTKTSAFTLQPNQFESQTLSYSRANTRGFSRNFFAALGLPQNVINDLYKKPMTIRLNMTVRVRRVEDALIQYSIRFLAN